MSQILPHCFVFHTWANVVKTDKFKLLLDLIKFLLNNKKHYVSFLTVAFYKYNGPII